MRTIKSQIQKNKPLLGLHGRYSTKRLLLSTVVFFILSGAAYARDYGDAIVSASIADARTLMPILASDSASSQVSGMIFNGLVKYDKDINLIGDLAESWEIKDNGLVIIFHLRKGVRWQDGHPFTSRDVEFTYRKMIDPEVRTPYSGDFERVKSLQVLDDYTVKLTYKEPFVPALGSWGMPIIPKHLLKNQDINNSEFSRHPIGTGPYKLKSWSTQDKIELISNHDYFEKRPYLDRYIYKVIPDEATIFLELQTRNIDSAGLTPLQYSRQTDSVFFKNNFHKFLLPSFTYVYMGYNLSNPKFKDPRIRQALNYAVDKEEIIKIVLLGYGTVSNGPFVPQLWAHNPEVEPFGYDPELAKKLLLQAGWSDSNQDGWLDKDKEIFEFTIITNQGNQERIKTAQIIQLRLKDIGIKVNIKVVEWSVFIGEFIDKRNFEAIIMGWSLPLDPDNFDIWHSSKTRPGEFNFVGFKNREVDALLEEARREFNLEKRKSYYWRINRIIYDEQPYMFLYVPDSLSILSSRFEGVKPEPIGIGYNFIDWWVPKDKQKYRAVQ